jgi:precorrin-2 dehydrogenase
VIDGDNKMNELRFPMFIPLNHKKIMVFGAGKVAYRRINTLLLFHADITVIAPSVCQEIENLIIEKKIYWLKGSYPDYKIEQDAFLVLAATDNAALNEDIYKVCKQQHILVNNASNQTQCDFFFPAIVSTEDLVVGITGNGTNHKKVSSMAKKIRDELEVRSDE